MTTLRAMSHSMCRMLTMKPSDNSALVCLLQQTAPYHREVGSAQATWARLLP